MVVYDRHSETSVAIDGRETAPGRMTNDLYKDMRMKNGKTVRYHLFDVPKAWHL